MLDGFRFKNQNFNPGWICFWAGLILMFIRVFCSFVVIGIFLAFHVSKLGFFHDDQFWNAYIKGVQIVDDLNCKGHDFGEQHMYNSHQSLSWVLMPVESGSFDPTDLWCCFVAFLPLFPYKKIDCWYSVLEPVLVSWWIIWLIYRSKEWWRREKRWHLFRVGDSPSGDSSPLTIFRSAKYSSWRKMESPFD